MVTTTTLDRTEGIAKLKTALQVIRESIEDSDGIFNVKMEVNSNRYTVGEPLIVDPLTKGHSINNLLTKDTA